MKLPVIQARTFGVAIGALAITAGVLAQRSPWLAAAALGLMLAVSAIKLAEVLRAH